MVEKKYQGTAWKNGKDLSNYKSIIKGFFFLQRNTKQACQSTLILTNMD